jgi:hypothetical protein
MSVPYLNLNAGDGISVVFKNQIFIPMPVPVQGLPMPVTVMKVGTIDGTFVEWIRDSEGDPVGVVLTTLEEDTFCLPLATPDDRGGVYVAKLHDGAIEEMKAQRNQMQAAQEKASGRSPAVVLAHSVPGGRPPGRSA